MQPVYVKAREKYGADVDAFLKDAAGAQGNEVIRHVDISTCAGRPGASALARARTGRRLVGVIGIGATMASLVFFNVSLHLVNKDLAWVTELGELLMVWVTFWAGPALPGEART